MSKFNSQEWFPKIKVLANAYYNNAGKKFVSYNESVIDKIEEIYESRLSALKKEIYNDVNLVGKRIDHHKIAALYIQLFLEKPVFDFPRNMSPTSSVVPNIELINEMFCCHILYAILKSWDGRAIDRKKFAEYEDSFLKLLYQYRVHSEFHKKNAFFTYNLAHLIYFIEEKFT
ncbi:MAG: hypothetical protein FWB85_00805 [Chitinispirillia bacterium]|nr:hypothetical protein [Chitinispirillia bacterium]MCL2241041.1 hypothetical protein [Chitinispirillia bacterium]